MWLSTLHTPPGLTSFLHYVALFCIPLAVAAALVARLPEGTRPYVIVGGIATAFLLVFLWGRVDRYSEHWVDDEGPGRASFTDWRWRSGGDIYYRAAWVSDDNGLSYIAEGPMSASHKQHGEWDYEFFGDEHRSEKKWYWYGERITEGEWHLRN